MKHPNPWIVDPDEVRPSPSGADTQVGLLRFRAIGLFAEIGTKTPDRLKAVPSHRHVAGPDVTDCRARLGESPMAAANDPTKLRGEPSWRVIQPQRLNKPAHPDGSCIGHSLLDLRDPVDGRYGVIIDEGDKVPARDGCTTVSGTSCARVVNVLDNGHVRKITRESGREVRVSVDGNDDLVSRTRLPSQRVDCRQQIRYSISVVGGDYYRRSHRVNVTIRYPA